MARMGQILNHEPISENLCLLLAHEPIQVAFRERKPKADIALFVYGMVQQYQLLWSYFEIYVSLELWINTRRTQPNASAACYSTPFRYKSQLLGGILQHHWLNSYDTEYMWYEILSAVNSQINCHPRSQMSQSPVLCPGASNACNSRIFLPTAWHDGLCQFICDNTMGEPAQYLIQ